MAIATPAYFKWRDGRPRWEPGPGLRAKGWIGRDLKDGAGRWLGLEAAIAAAVHLNRDVAEWRRTGRRPKLAPAGLEKPGPDTCRALVARWLASAHMQARAAATQADYRNKAAVWLEAMGSAPVRALTKPIMYGFWEELHHERGHAMANGVIAVARAALSHAERIGWRPERSNPCFHLQLLTLPPRVVVWTPAEIAHLVATADGLGQAEIGDAVILALHSGQRQGDVLGLEEAQTDGGLVTLRQSKTGALVRVPLTEQLRARLEAIRARRRAHYQGRGAVVPIGAAQPALGPLLLHPRTGRPWAADTFRHAFAAARAAAAEQMPAIAGKWFLDLRDTAITRLALAGCTVPMIRAITGHSLETVHAVLKHYLALDEASARQGIELLQSWMTREGIAL